jgi:hypothetical protein
VAALKEQRLAANVAIDRQAPFVKSSSSAGGGGGISQGHTSSPHKSPPRRQGRRVSDHSEARMITPALVQMLRQLHDRLDSSAKLV